MEHYNESQRACDVVAEKEVSLSWPFVNTRWLVALVLMVAFARVKAQQVEINGFLRDSLTSEPLIGATILAKGALQASAATNLSGYFTIRIPKGQYELFISSLGYKSIALSLHISSDTILNLWLSPDAINLREVTVTAESAVDRIKNTEIGTVRLSMSEIKSLPVLFGEVDILKSLQLLPGVQSAGEGNTGLYIRGGGADQNLVLLDDAQVFNTGHLFGFVSVFNPDAIQGAQLIKGGMPASYGGRLSAVIDVNTKEGNYRNWTAEGGLGLLTSRLTVQGPIQKDKSSILFSARRSYLDLITKPFLENNGVRGFPYYFYDFNLKTTYRFGDRDQISLSAYTGRDVLALNLLQGRIKANLDWGNRALSLRWTRAHSRRLFSTYALIHNRFGFSALTNFDNIEANVNSDISDYSFKADWKYVHSPLLKFKTGVQYILRSFTPRRSDARIPDSEVSFSNPLNISRRLAHDIAPYLQAEWAIGDRLRVNTGIRLASFTQVGPYDYVQIENGLIVDTLSYRSFQTITSFTGWEPRLSASYSLSEHSSFKFGYNRNHQFVHLVSLSSNSLPFDIWVPSSVLVQPQRGDSWSMAYVQLFSKNRFEFTVEPFYRTMKQQVEYREDYVPQINGELEREFVFGKGRAYGLELLIRKRQGKFQGWVGYTLSRTERQFDLVNKGQWFLSRFDRLHDLSIVANYSPGKRWDIGLVFVFGSGQPITVPERRYFIEGQVVNQYGPRNNFRMESYHRMDLSATYHFKPRKRLRSSLTMSVYNVYSRKNPLLYFIEPSGSLSDGSLGLQAKKLYLFPILPSVTWNFQF